VIHRGPANETELVMFMTWAVSQQSYQSMTTPISSAQWSSVLAMRRMKTLVKGSHLKNTWTVITWMIHLELALSNTVLFCNPSSHCSHSSHSYVMIHVFVPHQMVFPSLFGPGLFGHMLHSATKVSIIRM
jgi:hypothetical protein